MFGPTLIVEKFAYHCENVFNFFREFRGEEVQPGENIDLNIYKHKDTTVSQLTLHKVDKNRYTSIDL